jgi:glucose/arabinose dehydrogenase
MAAVARGNRYGRPLRLALNRALRAERQEIAMLQKTFITGCLVVSLAVTAHAAEITSATLAGGLKNPQAVAASEDGRIFVTTAGELGKDGDGEVFVIQNGKTSRFAAGLDDPKGIVSHRDSLYVVDKNRVLKIDAAGKPTVLAAADTFPSMPHDLSSIAVEYEKGTLFVGDLGDEKGNGAAVFRVSTAGGDLRQVGTGYAAFGRPAGLLLDGAAFILVADSSGRALHRVKIVDGSVETLRKDLRGVSGLNWDAYGRLFLCNSAAAGGVSVIPRPGVAPISLPGIEPARAVCVNQTNHELVSLSADGVKSTKIVIPGWEVEETSLALESVTAFPKLEWANWSPETPDGKVNHLRPIVLTHAGDGSSRVFLATQHGVIHVFPNDPNAEKSQVFLDIEDRVRYSDKEDEEGFLGLAFHPRYKETGEFFVFYTPKKANKRHTNFISRFRVRKDNPNQADPASEEVLLKIEHRFFNHDGGTLAFGPDGYLYIAVGDGGLAADPFRNGQNINTLLGKILRIDIDHKAAGKPYAIPADNPFANRKDAAPEIWCYGLRNVWRFSFDRETKACWASDVGQDLWEEINLVTRGGNYGWNVRESLHPFGVHGVGPRKDLIDPIWEYHHSIGKSITGGGVYRGSRLPELRGAYLYADYVAGTVNALRYDTDKARVVANQPIRTKKLPIVSFGEDEEGEMYFLCITATGKGISRFERRK